MADDNSPLLNENTELQPLNSTDTNESLLSRNRSVSISDSWKWYHTATVLCIRLIIDFVFKNPLIFYINFADGLNITYAQFGYILIASEIGCICATFFGEINQKYLKTEENIIELYLIIAGIGCILFPLLTSINSNNNLDSLYIIIWCCFARFIVGISFSFISAASIKFASSYVPNKNKITSIIAILHYSWPLSTAINILAGYLIQFTSWIYVFILSGILLIFVSIFAKLIFYFFKLPQITSTQTATSINTLEMVQQEDDRNAMRIIFTDFNCLLIIFVSFFMTFRSRSIYIVTSSLWMEDVFNLSVSILGWTTLAVIIGEVVGLFIMSTVTHKYELWSACAATLIHQLIFGLLLFIIAIVYGNSAGSLIISLIFIGLLTMGHESFYVVQQSNAIHYAPLPRVSFSLLLAERMAQEAASIVVLLIVTNIWLSVYSNAILIFSVIWIGLTFLESMVLFIYKSEPTVKIKH